MSYPRADARLSGLLTKVESLRPLVETYRLALSEGPDLPLPIAEAFLRAGLAQLWAPAEVNGAELPAPDLLRVVEAVAKLDGSLGWCTGISAVGTRILGLLSEAASRRVTGNKTFGSSGSLLPGGRAVREGDGWRVQGQWHFASFSRYSSLSLLGCIEYEDGSPKILDGNPVTRLVVSRSDGIKVVGNWNATGLRASGSHDIECHDVWVPDDQTSGFSAFQLPRSPGRPLYDIPLVSSAAISCIGVPLGIAAAAIDAFADIARKKVSFLQTASLQEQEIVQLTVGRSKAKLASARAYAHAAVASVWAASLNGTGASIAEQVDLRQACWNAADVARGVVGDMYRMAGIAAAPNDSLLATQFRDIHLVSQHINFADRLLVAPGRVALGMAPGSPVI